MLTLPFIQALRRTKKSLVTFACILLGSVVFSQQITRVEKLQQEINNTKVDSTLGRLYGLLAWELKFKEPKQAIELAEKEIKIGYSSKDPLRLADGYRIKALTLVIEEEIIEGMGYYDSALVYARKAGSLYYESSCYSLMAGMYGDHGDYDKAIELYAKGLEVAQKSGDKKMIATLSNNLAESYQSNGRKTDQAQKYFLMALENSMAIKNWPMAGMNSANLTKEYLRCGEKEKALAELPRSINLLNKDKTNAYQYATNSHILASVEFELGNMQAAEQYALVSIHIMDSLQQPDNVLRPLTVLAQTYIATQKIVEAKLYASRLLNDALKQNAKLYIRDAYKALSDIARMEKDALHALSFYELYKAYNDSVFEMGREQTISNMETRALLAQKEMEIKYETDKKDQENKTLQTINNGLQLQKLIAVVACIIFIGLGILLWIAYRKTQKINAELAIEKKIVEKQAREKEALVHEIHHRVKNNLTMLKSLLYLQAQSAQHDETKRILQESQARIQSMAMVHQNLYEENESGTTDFVEFLEQMFSDISESFKLQGQQVKLEVLGICEELNISKAIPLGLIMNELITNSMKYAFQNSLNASIEIKIEEKNQELYIEYADNGPGLKNGFDLTKGGFGFKLLDILSQQLNATILYEKQVEQSIFKIQLPLGG